MLLLVHSDGTYFEWNPQEMRIIVEPPNDVEFESLSDSERWGYAVETGRFIQGDLDLSCQVEMNEKLPDLEEAFHYCGETWGHDGPHKCAYVSCTHEWESD